MTDINHNAKRGHMQVLRKYGVDLRGLVTTMSEQHKLCPECIWEKVLDYPDIATGEVALAQAVHDLNARRAVEDSGIGSILAAIFGKPETTPEFISAEDFFGMEARVAFPTPGPISESDKREILRRAGFAPTLDQEEGVWVADDIELIDGGFSGGIAWQAAWEVFLANEEVYRHYKGGVYIRGCDGRSSEDGSAITVYEHIWPHEPEIWTRPKGEFDEPGRFVRMTE